MQELARCPFCNSRKVSLKEWLVHKGDGYSTDGYRVSCEICGTDGPFAITEESAQKSWNKRVSSVADEPSLFDVDGEIFFDKEEARQEALRIEEPYVPYFQGGDVWPAEEN